MAKKKFDELNILSTDSESSENFDYQEYIDHYFDPMQITEKQRKERIEAAEELMDAILLFLMWCENAPERVQEEETHRLFENMYKEVVYQYSEPDNYFDTYVPMFISNLIDTTLRHLDDEYFTSTERAADLAVNESNTVIQYEEVKDAVDSGYNVKIWQTQLDDRVRDSHAILEGMKVGILDYFPVGSSYLLFPRDEKNCSDLADIAGCRCSLRFDYSEEYDSVSVSDLENEVETEEQKHKNPNSIPTTEVDWANLTDDELRRKIALLGEDNRTSRMIFEAVKETLQHRSGTYFEDLSYISRDKKKWLSRTDYDYYDENQGISSCRPSKPMKAMLKEEEPYSVIGLHNHPKSGTPSLSDIVISKERQYAYGLAIGHNGTLFRYKTNEDFYLEKDDKYKEFLIDAQLDKLYVSLHNDDTNDTVSVLSELIGLGIKIEVFR